MKIISLLAIVATFIGFDLVLHIYQLVLKKYLVYFPDPVYDYFWTIGWGVMLVLVISAIILRGKEL